MILSLSASYDDAVSKYAWMKFTGTRGKEVSQRTHKRMIREGDVFGILPLRNGGRYTLIFADMPHVDFPLDKTVGLFLLERSTKLRKVPEIKSTRTKTAGAQTLQKKVNRVQFDAARFSPKGIVSEARNGLNFSNYQWRMVPNNEYPVKTTKGLIKLNKNDMIGVRFMRQGKGGLVVDVNGLFLKVDDAQYDLLVHDTNVLPFQEWPQGEVSVDTIKAYTRSARRNHRRTQEEEAEAIRLAGSARATERTQQRKELMAAERAAARARSTEMRDLRSKVKSGEIEAPKADIRTVYADGIQKRGKRVREIELENLEEEDLGVELEVGEQKLEDILMRSQFSGDSFNIEGTIGGLFSGDDSEDHEPAELDLSDIDEPEDEEEVAPEPKVRAKKEVAPEPEPEADAEDADTEDTEDDADTEDGEDVEDVEDVEDEDAEEDVEDDTEEDTDAEEEADDEEEEEDVEDTDGADDSEDADSTEAVDELEADEDQDSDVAAAEAEAKETAKKIAAANKSTPTARAQEAEEGDVLKFKADDKLQRDWVVLRVSSHAASDNIVVYTLYDITNSPDEVRQVRINRARKQNLFDYAEHVKDMPPKLFNSVLDMAEDYDVNKEPIAS